MRKPPKSITALPTLVTLGNAFCGFLAATYLLEAARARGVGHDQEFFEYLIKAVWSMFTAMIFDFLDGKVARLTGAESAFGVQMDSLCDVLSFGLVPALMFKTLGEFGLDYKPKFALFLACFHLFGATLRLARFNVEADLENDDHRSFKGLPSPAAAAGVASIVLLYANRALERGIPEPATADLVLEGIRSTFPYVIALLGILMWTRLPYIHVANVLLTEKRQPAHLLAIIGTIGVVALDPPVAFAVLMLSYALSGPALYVRDLLTGRSTVEGESLL